MSPLTLCCHYRAASDKKYVKCAEIDCDGECGQFVRDTPRTARLTNESLFEKYRYRADTTNVNWKHLVANLSLYKDEAMLATLGFPITNFTHCQRPSEFVFVTAADRKYFHTAMDAIASLQAFFPNNSIYFYDLSNGGLRRHVAKVGVQLMCIFTCSCSRYRSLTV